MVKSLSHGLFGIKGLRLSYLISIILATTLAVGCFLMKSLLMGSIFSLFVLESYRQFQASYYLSTNDEKEDLKELLQKGITFFQEKNLNEAALIFTHLRQELKEGLNYITASLYLALIFENQGEFFKAYHLLIPLEKHLDLKFLKLLQTLSFKNQDYRRVIDLGKKLYEEQADPEVALLMAKSHAALQEIRPAIGWLKTAYTEDQNLVSEALETDSFHLISKQPEFTAFLEKIQ